MQIISIDYHVRHIVDFTELCTMKCISRNRGVLVFPLVDNYKGTTIFVRGVSTIKSLTILYHSCLDGYIFLFRSQLGFMISSRHLDVLLRGLL